jgi:filamentous hemagglutinin
LTSVAVGSVRSDDDSGTASATADLTLSGGTASVGGLQVGTAAASSHASVTADASARFEDMTFTGTGEWTIGRAVKGGFEGPVGSAVVSQATAVVEGDDASTANLSGLNIGVANAGYGTAQIDDSQFSFTGESVTTTTLSLGTAASGQHGHSHVKGASADFTADLFVTGDAAVGVGSAGASDSGSATIGNVGLTVEAGHVFDVGGALTVGSAAADAHAKADVAGCDVTLGDGVDFSVGGLLTIGQATNSGYRGASVADVHLTLDGGSVSLGGGLAVGLATENRVKDAGVSDASLLLKGTSFTGGGAWTIGEAISTYVGDATVSGVQVAIEGDGTSAADLTSVIVGHAKPGDRGTAQVADASLTYSGGTFNSSNGLVVGWAEVGKTMRLGQATDAATFRDAEVSVRSLQVGRYTGVGEQNPSSFAHGSMTLADSILTVDEDAEFARLTGGVGSATSALSLTRSLLDVDGDLLLGDGSKLLLQIDGYDEFGRIEAGTASLDGDVTVAFDFTLTGIGTWDLITLDEGSSFMGDFDSEAVLGLSAGTAWSLGFATNDSGQAVYRLAVTDVPIDPVAAPAPGAIGLLCVGLGIVLRRRR